MLPRPLIRTLRCTVALAIGAAALLGGTVPSWSECAKASFDGVCDGSGDGKSLPAALGTLTTSTASGKPLKDVAPSTAVTKERLALSDNGTSAATTFGVRLGTTSAALGGAYSSVVVEPQIDGGHFTIGLTDSSAQDFCLPGSAGDGVTVEMCAVECDEGVLSVGGTKLKTTLKKGTRYRIEMTAYDVGDSGDYVEAWVTNLATGEFESFTQALGGGFKPVRALTIKKHAGRAGDWLIDDLVVLAQSK